MTELKQDLALAVRRLVKAPGLMASQPAVLRLYAPRDVIEPSPAHEPDFIDSEIITGETRCSRGSR